MSSKNKTLKLTIPNDIGEEEIFINHRQKLIEERLLNSQGRSQNFQRGGSPADTNNYDSTPIEF